MKLNIYTIYDDAAKAYMQPFMFQTDGLAVRAFSDNINSDKSNNISEHPEQFTLFKIGEFDDQAATIATFEPPQMLGNGRTYKTDDLNARKGDIDTILAIVEEILDSTHVKEPFKTVAEMRKEQK